MKHPILITALLSSALLASAHAEPALTIYNQNFAVVRDTVPLDLKPGRNDVSFPDTTAFLEPDSVVLRDPTGKNKLLILEQSYRNDPVSQGLLLSLNEGKTIDFIVREDRVVKGKIIRSGYVPQDSSRQRFGPQYSQMQAVRASEMSQPIIEVEGKIQFTLPGQPVFSSLGDDTILKPALTWGLEAAQAAKFDAELAYLTGGLSWQAAYNVVAPEKGDTLDIVGWVTMDNQSGKTFRDAKIKLMAGDVNKIQPEGEMNLRQKVNFAMAEQKLDAVTEQSFDEYHLYTISRPTTLLDRQVKQVEFVRATGVKSERIYVYDGFDFDPRPYGYNRQALRMNEEIGSESKTTVAVVREFKNSAANNLGIPLPAGRLRFYRQADDGQLEFTGENVIKHTPKDEIVRVYTGNAFDLVGERRRTSFKVDSSAKWVEESFEIKLRNHKKEAVEIRVVEHLFRWVNWEILEKSNPFTALNAQQIEFRVALKPDEEKILTYKVRYSW